MAHSEDKILASEGRTHGIRRLMMAIIQYGITDVVLFLMEKKHLGGCLSKGENKRI
jgi:hypothetical protein